MKLSHSLILGLAISIPSFAQNKMPSMRKYKEQETGLAYTFSRVNIGGLNQAPAFASTIEEGTTPNDSHTDFRNIRMDEALEFGYNLVHNLEDSAHKIFFDLNYIHADQNTRCPVNTNIGANQSISIPYYLNPFGATKYFVSGTYNYPFFAQIKGHFDLASAQSGVSYRFFRTKNIDFSLFGGSDAAYFTYTSKTNVFVIAGSSMYYTKSTTHVNNLNDKNGMDNDVANFAAANDENPFSSIFKTRFYGAGPLFGAKLQVPFNNEFLRLNIKAELSALMGYGTAYLQNNYTVISSPTSPSIPGNVYSNRNFQRHNFKLIPTFRGEISLDVIIKNFMFTGGLQQAVYFQAMDINPLIDSGETNGDNLAVTTRDRNGQITTGGPFVKLSVLF